MDPILFQADELGIHLEIVGGLAIWEAKPVLKHQRAVDKIRESIQKQPGISSETGCGCIHYADVYVAFPGRFAETTGYRHLLPGAGRRRRGNYPHSGSSH